MELWGRDLPNAISIESNLRNLCECSSDLSSIHQSRLILFLDRVVGIPHHRTVTLLLYYRSDLLNSPPTVPKNYNLLISVSASSTSINLTSSGYTVTILPLSSSTIPTVDDI